MGSYRSSFVFELNKIQIEILITMGRIKQHVGLGYNIPAVVPITHIPIKIQIPAKDTKTISVLGSSLNTLTKNNYAWEFSKSRSQICLHDNKRKYIATYKLIDSYEPKFDTRYNANSNVNINATSDSGSNNNESEKNGKGKEIDKKLLRRKANLGAIIQMLQIKVPNMLTDLPPQEIVSENIVLKVLPNQFPNLPLFKGYMMYATSLKTIQKLLLMFYLNPESKIHISNIKVVEPTNSMSSNELITLSIDNNHLENGTISDASTDRCNPISQQDTSKYTTKIKIKWRTCFSGCIHLQDKETTNAKWGSYSLDHFDWTKLLKSSNPLQTLSLLEAKKTLEGFAKQLDPLSNSNGKLDDRSGIVGRVLTGIFIFELDAENEKIVAFTIDNMEILESKEMDFSDGCLAA